MMRCAAIFLILASSGVLVHAAEESFSYASQDEWPGICVEGNSGRQSPINVVTDDVVENDGLIELDFGACWEDAYAGTFGNTGHNQQFDPAEGSCTATTRNHLGTYGLLQFHMHWGDSNGVGSEHRFDGSQYDVEIHFVHLKQGDDVESSDEDYISVIGVFANAVDEPISGVWAQLQVQSAPDDAINVTNIDLMDLIPPEGYRHYYYYRGSLTTPNCDEVAHFFLFTTPIGVPQAYLDSLRMVDGDADQPLDMNFRNVQDLNGRMVYTMESGAGIATILSSWLLLLVAFMAFVWV